MTGPTASSSTSTTSTSAPSGAPRTAGGRVLRACLWLVLALAAVGNTVASAVGVAIAVQAGFGVVTAACVAALVTVHLRGRR